jgi:hypothetical protein
MFLTELDLYRRKRGRVCPRTFDGTTLQTKLKNDQRVRIPLKVTASVGKISCRFGFSYQLKSNY